MTLRPGEFHRPPTSEELRASFLPAKQRTIKPPDPPWEEEVEDFDERYALYEQANKILVDDAPYIYMYAKSEVKAWSPRVPLISARRWRGVALLRGRPCDGGTVAAPAVRPRRRGKAPATRGQGRECRP